MQRYPIATFTIPRSGRDAHRPARESRFTSRWSGLAKMRRQGNEQVHYIYRVHVSQHCAKSITVNGGSSTASISCRAHHSISDVDCEYRRRFIARASRAGAGGQTRSRPFPSAATCKAAGTQLRNGRHLPETIRRGDPERGNAAGHQLAADLDGGRGKARMQDDKPLAARPGRPHR